MKNYRSLSAVVVALAGLSLLAGCASTRSAGEQFSDAEISSRIKTKLTADPEVNPFNIDVDTLDGVVTLRGKVAKEAARAEAEKLAADTRGVVDVVNEIQVAPGETQHERLSDAWITSKVKSKLAADPQVNPFNIDVDTSNGVVTLSGAVRSEAARAEAEKLAVSTEGVESVVNRVTVKPRSGSG